MPQARRGIDRRRRVLYTAATEFYSQTAASRREVARLRQARCPSATYGSRVKNRLRGRWFSLVPVRRRSLTIVVLTLTLLAGTLCVAHYAAVAWPSVAHRNDIARPLRLDRNDSFGRWMIVMLTLATAGTSFLIYQLRRHRLDDFRGHYRLWWVLLLVSVVASIHALVGLIDWGGALIDAILGRRVAMSGADWLRIAVTISGAVLFLRLLAEIRRAPAAVAWLLLSAALLALPETARWQVIQVESVGLWSLVTAAPLLAFTALFIACLVYLRMLYREVRRLNETDTLKGRLAELKLRIFHREAEEPGAATPVTSTQPAVAGQPAVRHDEHADPDEDAPRSSRATRRRGNRPPTGDAAADGAEKRRWWQRKRPRQAAQPEPTSAAIVAAPEPEPAAETDTDEASQSAAPRRRWFGLRRAPAAAEAERDADNEATEQPAARQRRRFSLRLAPRKPKPTEDDSGSSNPQPTRSQQPSQQHPNSAEPELNPDEIDWNSLSKAERRRLRKQLKRHDRAA